MARQTPPRPPARDHDHGAGRDGHAVPRDALPVPPPRSPRQQGLPSEAEDYTSGTVDDYNLDEESLRSAGRVGRARPD